ncbi:DUF1307 domain-containing protein [Atopobacter sp. AH10]|uniref:DUF1307 domain-containing protein n=1 Tax=Atopobacter sp. AH10 TaxID=2315861 RepID=UPI000EF22055|nr:DUF1307 domain-containing protein [Atopobacter sp. AH10]RLK62582.1 DUF1307 domain-containing protein [Atopobacter sp. AH10]
MRQLKKWGLVALVILVLSSCGFSAKESLKSPIKEVTHQTHKILEKAEGKKLETYALLKEMPEEKVLVIYRHKGDRILQEITKTLATYSSLSYGNRYQAMQDSHLADSLKAAKKIKGLDYSIDFKEFYLIEEVAVDYEKVDRLALNKLFPSSKKDGLDGSKSLEKSLDYLKKKHFKPVKKLDLASLEKELLEEEKSKERMDALVESLKAKMQARFIKVYQKGSMEKGEMAELRFFSEDNEPVSAVQVTLFRSYKGLSEKERIADQKKWQKIIRQVNHLDGAAGQMRVTKMETHLGITFDPNKVDFTTLKKMDLFKKLVLKDNKLLVDDMKKFLKEQAFEEVKVDGLKAFDGDE